MLKKIIENKYSPFVVFAILLFILLVNNWSINVIDQDEAAYAGFGKTMIEQKNWLIPEFMWSEVHRKPPLLFWLIAISQSVFGINEFATRLPVVIAVFLIYVFVYFQVKKFYDKKTALLSITVLGTSLFVPTLGKFAYTDGLLLLFHTLAAFSLINIIQTRSYKWVALFWFAFAMGLLTKGPPIMIFTGFLTILLFIVHKKRWNLIIIHPWFFMPIAFVPLFLWGYFVWQLDNGEFITWMLDWYVLKRVDQSVFGQTGPPGYFLATFIIFFLPYLTFLPKAFVNTFKAIKTKKIETLILLAWIVAGWLFYEFLRSKLPTYAIAAYPAIAIIIAKQIIDLHKDSNKMLLLKIASIFQFIISLAISIGIFVATLNFFPSIGIIIASIISTTLIIGTFLSILFLWKRKFEKATIFFVSNATLFVILTWTFLMPKIDDLRNSTERVATFIKENSVANKTVVIANRSGRPPSLPFYIMQQNNKAKVVENYEENFIKEKYLLDSAYIFVLKEDMANSLKAKIPEIEITVIESLSTDRTDMAKYYIVINKKAKKIQ